jgi:hypothetical protein
MSTDLQSRFQQAAEDSKKLPKRPDNNTLLKLYSLYKQSTLGDVTGSRPAASTWRQNEVRRLGQAEGQSQRRGDAGIRRSGGGPEGEEVMPIYDISLTISNDLPVWPGDTPVNLVRNSDMQQGELVTLSQLTSTVHVGSHLDAPRHFVRDGHGVDQIDLGKLIGPCRVVDLPDATSIDAQALEQANIPAMSRACCAARVIRILGTPTTPFTPTSSRSSPRARTGSSSMAFNSSASITSRWARMRAVSPRMRSS